MPRSTCFVALMVAVLAGSLAPRAIVADDETLLLRFPTISRDHVAFVYAGDLWVAPRAGGDARRLTTHDGYESNPTFSPDGRLVAFSGSYDGNTDVYVVPAEGGAPRRLTWHPGADLVRGFTPDGRSVAFRTQRDAFSVRSGRHFTVPVEGGFPEPMILPVAERGAFSPDGERYAYTPITDAFGTWKRYRGGQTTPIWIFDFDTHEIEEIPHENASDTFPMWIGDTVYFLSDRNGVMNLFAYDTQAGSVRQATRHGQYDIRSASAGDGVIVYEQRGRLHLFDPATNRSETLKIRVRGDLPHARPQYAEGRRFIRNFDLSPSGVRAVFEVRGEIVTVPAKKGDARFLTESSGVHDRDPSWSPDGKHVAWFHDGTGEYGLVVGRQDGKEEPRRIPLGEPSFYYAPRWSPDSERILFTDKRLNLSYVDLESEEVVHVDTDTYDHPARSLDPTWSADSRYIAYTKRLDNHLHALFVYDTETRETHQVTDGLSDARYPAFSRDGEHLYFAASTNLALSAGWLDLSSYGRQPLYGLYVALLDADASSPFAKESDEEPFEEGDGSEGNEAKKEGESKEGEQAAPGASKADEKGAIDFEGIERRILAIPGIASGAYASLQSAKEGRLFYLDRPATPGAPPGAAAGTLWAFDLSSRKTSQFLSGVAGYRVSAKGDKLIYAAPANRYGIVPTAGKASPGQGSLDVASLRVRVHPREEWRQIFEEAWRIERDFFYDPGMHGANWSAIREKYRPFVEHVGHRAQLNFLLAEMIGELVVGHAYVGGGDTPSTESVPGGLLGADVALDDDGYYRIEKIYSGHNWNPSLRAPLTEPGVDVREGDYVLAVDGEPLRAPSSFFAPFERKAGRRVELLVNDRPAEEGARRETVVPIPSERMLRVRDWIERNRRIVDERSEGRLAYVYMPDTSSGGFTAFNRDYFAGIGRHGAVIDERYNGGGFAADYVIDLLDRPLMSYWVTREGKPFTTPNAAIFGPKVMIINEYSSSGGDAMPYYFRQRGLGPLVGTRTWGGLVGIYDYPVLVDGGFLTAPRVAIVSPEGEFVVENEGVAPDHEVPMTPKEVIAGRDPQLERAIELCLERLEATERPELDLDPYPTRARD